MKKFVVCIEETVVQEFEVISENEEEARKIAENKYKKGEFVLEAGEVQYKQLAVINSDGSEMEWNKF